MKKEPYDILLFLSGGKDSCSLAFFLKERGVNVLAFTNDVGFLSNVAKENIKKTVEILNIDHLMFKPSINVHRQIIKDFFEDRTQSMKDVCLKCSQVIQSNGYAVAKMLGIKEIMMGFTKYNATAQIKCQSPSQVVGDIHILNPYYRHYDLKAINKTLQKYGIVTDPTKTNCKFIERIIATHIERFGENPFKKELDLLLDDKQIDEEEYAYFSKFGASKREAEAITV